MVEKKKMSSKEILDNSINKLKCCGNCRYINIDVEVTLSCLKGDTGQNYDTTYKCDKWEINEGLIDE